ncbi:hypothetical protein AAON49_02100 [Pseudotenacibaculum sp. MALMAid0570]|uniref:hypothetical protein n=1 Tax=Pseudotenacibaculum sp. MALMAid0570 TaxID=3143938 RepID=UPI0032DE9F06
MKKLFPLFLLLMVSVSGFSQQADTLSIPEKFDRIYRTSSSYQEYKVIRKTRFQDLKKQVSDSMNSIKSELKTKEQLIRQQKDSIKNAKEVADILGADLKQTITQKNNIQFLGLEFPKSTYNLMVWGIIIALAVLLFYFIYKFKNSNIVTTHAKIELSELEEEFAIHKKKALEREQKLRRQLQDEINKQRGV